MSTRPRAPEIVFSKEPDWDLFDAVAMRMLDHFDARVLEANDGLDERTWDVEIEGQTLALNLSLKGGIRLSAADVAAKPLLKRIGDFIGTARSARRSEEVSPVDQRQKR